MKKFRKIRNKALSLTAAALITCTAAAPAFMQKPSVYAGQQLGQTDFDDGIGLPGISLNPVHRKCSLLSRTAYIKLLSTIPAELQEAARIAGTVSSVTVDLK